MWFGLLVLITALSISSVAIWYSVAGLVAIFAAAAVPIIIMGVVLEVGKLVTAVWLHNYWGKATWWLKTYLSLAVVVLMFITSMGIFGFLSKAHIEQTAASDQSFAQIERLELKIQAEQSIIDTANQRITQLETTGSTGQQNIQNQIEVEQARINATLARIQPQIDEQQAIIATKSKSIEDQISRIDAELLKLEGHLSNGEIALAQTMIGVSADGRWGTRSQRAAAEWQEAKAEDRSKLLTKLEFVPNDPIVTNARREIDRIRNSVQAEIDRSNQLISTYSEQLATSDQANLSALISEQRVRINEASDEIDKLTDEKFELQSEYRKLEAEVGPIRYIAEFIYGDKTDQNLLEEAVRWVIVTIIFVFDPLAVLLLIAAQYTFRFSRSAPPSPNTPVQKKTENINAEKHKNQKTKVAETKKNSIQNKNDVREETTLNQNTVVDLYTPQSEVSKDQIFDTLWEMGNDKDGMPGISVDEFAEAHHKKKLTESSEDSSRLTIEEIEELELNDNEWNRNKRQWKYYNPDSTIKEYKTAYMREKIDYLPWDPKIYTYVQNDEQNENSIWNKIRNGNSSSNIS